MATKKTKDRRTAAQKNAKGTRKARSSVDWTDEHILLEVEGLARDGYDDGQIAEIFGQAKETFSRNKVKRELDKDGVEQESGLSKALREGRKPLTVMVENALFRRAIGVKTQTVRVKSKKMVLPDGEETDTVIVEESLDTIEHPPDTGAAIFWLKTHRPDVYNVPVPKVEDSKNSNALPVITSIEHVTVDSKSLKDKEAGE